MRALRRELAAANPDAAEQAAAHLPLGVLAPIRVVSGYHPLGGELSPWPLLARLAAAGARIALPVALDRASPLIFRAYAPGQSLEPDAVNIPSPTTEAETLVPDVVIVPLLAFDRAGYRLGQGAGHYDRTLQGLRARRPVRAVGLGYAGQRIERVPREAHDQALDAILTEMGYQLAQEDE